MLYLIFRLTALGYGQEQSAEKDAEENKSLDSNEPDELSEIPSVEIVVLGENDIHKKRKALEEELFKQGYQRGIDKGDRIVYRPQTAWKPSVVLYDSGFATFKRTPPRFEPFVNTDSWSDYLYCIPPLTLMCIKASGLMVSKRRLRHVKGDVVEGSKDELEAWQKSIVAHSSQIRLHETIPTHLEDLWLSGLSEPSDFSVQRSKDSIYQFWLTRACNDVGRQAQDIILDFVNEEIQTTEYSYSQTEYERFLQTRCKTELLNPVD